MYYADYFEIVKKIVNEIDPEERQSILQKKKKDSIFIRANLGCISSGMYKLETMDCLYKTELK